MRCTIKFAARYEKMPKEHLEETMLLAVFKVDRSELSDRFLEWDTKYADGSGYFKLPKGKEFLVLMLLSGYRLWTTIRAAWPPEKEEYYRSHVGEMVNIVVEGRT